MLVKVFERKWNSETTEVKILESMPECYTTLFEYTGNEFSPHNEFNSDNEVQFYLQLFDDVDEEYTWTALIISTNDIIKEICGTDYLITLSETDRKDFLFVTNYYLTTLIRELKTDYLDLTSLNITDDMKKEVLNLFESRTQDFMNNVVYCI